MKKSKSARSAGGESIEALFGVSDIEAGEDMELATDVRNAAASFLAALSKKKSKRALARKAEAEAAGDDDDAPAPLKGKGSTEHVASFWSERAIARGEKKKPKVAPAPVEIQEEEAEESHEHRKKRTKPGKAERAMLKRERESKTSQAALAGRAGKKSAAVQKKPLTKKGGLFSSDDRMWEE
jgi:hypothetical protein